MVVLAPLPPQIPVVLVGGRAQTQHQIMRLEHLGRDLLVGLGWCPAVLMALWAVAAVRPLLALILQQRNLVQAALGLHQPLLDHLSLTLAVAVAVATIVVLLMVLVVLVVAVVVAVLPMLLLQPERQIQAVVEAAAVLILQLLVWLALLAVQA